MQKRMLLALMLAMTLLLSSCSLIVKDEAVDNARPVLQLGDIVYTKGDVKSQVDLQLQYTQMIYNMYMGQYIDITDPEIVQDAQNMVLDSLTREAVIIAQARKLGLDVLTEDEKVQLEQAAQETWKSYRESFELELSLPETATEADKEAAIDRLCAQEGVSLETVRESEKLMLLDEKLQAHVIKDVTVSDAAIQAEFDMQVADAKAAYEADLSAYGADVLNGGTVYYRPAGYRNVKQILIQFSDEDNALLGDILNAADVAETRESEALTALTDLGVTDIETLAAQVKVTFDEVEGPTAEATVKEIVTNFTTEVAEDVQAAVQELAEARALKDYYIDQQMKAEARAFGNLDGEADLVLAALEAGEDWDVLSGAHNDDPGMISGAPNAETGYPVCEGFTQFDPAFVEAAMSIPSVGQWSGKTPGSFGYYIIQYTSDVAEGPVALEEVRDILQENALTAAQDEAYEHAIDQWIAEADVKIDLKPLND